MPVEADLYLRYLEARCSRTSLSSKRRVLIASPESVPRNSPAKAVAASDEQHSRSQFPGVPRRRRICFRILPFRGSLSHRGKTSVVDQMEATQVGNLHFAGGAQSIEGSCRRRQGGSRAQVRSSPRRQRPEFASGGN